MRERRGALADSGKSVTTFTVASKRVRRGRQGEGRVPSQR